MEQDLATVITKLLRDGAFDKWVRTVKQHLLAPKNVKVLYQLSLMVKDQQKLDPTLIPELMRALQLIGSLITANDVLRGFGCLHSLNNLIEHYYQDYKLTNDISQAASVLAKCKPGTLRNIGFGYNVQSGAFDVVIRLKQTGYAEVKTSWRVWDGAVLASRWIFQNKGFFEGKTVLELGAGCGLAGLVTSRYAKSTTITDGLESVIENITDNIKLNKRSLPSDTISTTLIDFMSDKMVFKKKFDIVIGTEIMYTVDIGKELAKTVSMYLKKGGYFYGISASYRLGVPSFEEELKNRGFVVEHAMPGKKEGLINDADDMTWYCCLNKAEE